ncbi:MAG: hypothetical protein EOO38_10690, partial [Cytophagaceae bacterium]
IGLQVGHAVVHPAYTYPFTWTSSEYSLVTTPDRDVFESFLEEDQNAKARGFPRAQAPQSWPRPESVLLPPQPLYLFPKPPRQPPVPPIPKHMPKAAQTSLSAQRVQTKSLPDMLGGVRHVHLDQEKKPMAVFELALAYVLANEGSTVTDDPQDHGGLTRYGVTQATLSAYLNRAAVPAEVHALTPGIAAQVYKKLYWTPIKAELIEDQAVATVLLDLSVLCGPSAAVKMLQAVLAIKIDGVVGPITLAAINKANKQTILQGLSLKACGYFSAIVVRDPTQVKFLPGWQIRAHKILKQNVPVLAGLV